MRDEVIALEDEAYSVVSVNVPVPVLIILGASAADDKVAGGIVVKSADDVEKGGFSAARGAKDGNKFLVAEGEIHTL